MKSTSRPSKRGDRRAPPIIAASSDSSGDENSTSMKQGVTQTNAAVAQVMDMMDEVGYSDDGNSDVDEPRAHGRQTRTDLAAELGSALTSRPTASGAVDNSRKVGGNSLSSGSGVAAAP